MVEFSLAGYIKLLSIFKDRGYIFSRFDEINAFLAVEQSFVILRHDIDISLRPALEIARIEHEQGVQATYFVWLHSPFYNLLNRLNVEIVQKIHAYGHQIALHVDLASYNGSCTEALMEIETLSKFYPYVDTRIASLHTPGDLKQLPIASYQPLYNVYGSTLKGDIAYISDSAGRWLYTHPLDSEAFHTGKPIQLLTHPIWWFQNGETPRKKLELWLHNDYMHTYATAKEFLPKLFRLNEREQIYKGVEQSMETQQFIKGEQLQLAAWNTTQQDYPLNIPLSELIAARAAATPTAIAVVTDHDVLSYQELNTRANQLAHHLQKLGVQPDMLVGCCINRSIDLVVGLLGILKAGAAYVPLDPDYPPERLTFMLEDAQVHTLVTLEKFAAHLSMGKNHIVRLDSDSVHLAQQNTTNPVSSATTNDLAYVIYTSGSTGLPKGVQVSHRSLLNLVFWHQRAFEVTASDQATQLTSPAFDATGWEIWPYLTAGASIHIPDENTRATPLALQHWLLNTNITISFVPTALAESLISLEWPTTASLRYLLTGADTLHRYPAPSLPFALINNYGPTEATVVATYGRVPPTPEAESAPTIGHPIDNTQIYILDEQLQQVPIGTPGELYIGGAGLARGYLNRPELTAERFISHPFSKEPEARLYKTGDRARFLADGQIAYMGRTDHQIKIRGYRIEPGEIIAALNEHPAIQVSIVVAREETPGDNRLVAYIVKVPRTEVTASSLRSKLQQRLPDYMMPATFVLLDALPLTVNGKIDRAMLPIPDEINTLRDGIIVAPTTVTERRLVEIIAPLLGLAQIGIDDNFFLLGGHSLLGTQVIVRVAEAFGVNLLLHSLFEAPTIRQLASEIEQLVLIKIETMNEEEILHLLEQG